MKNYNQDVLKKQYENGKQIYINFLKSLKEDIEVAIEEANKDWIGEGLGRKVKGNPMSRDTTVANISIWWGRLVELSNLLKDH